MVSKKVYENIKSVRIQGAMNIAKYSLLYLKSFAKKHGFGKKFEKEMKILEKIRPTAVVLHNVLEELNKEKSFEKINELLERLEEADDLVAKTSQKIIPKKATILTHCHSSIAVSCIKFAKKLGKRIRVIATVTEPLDQGLITARELGSTGIKVKLIEDNAVGYMMQTEKIDLVLVGTDALRKDGLINKIGTYTIAVLAKEHGIPFYSAGSYFKLDKRKKVIIEKRPWKEVLKRKIKNVEVVNPAFDLTPWKFVKGVVMEDKILTPKKLVRLLE